ncbi:hypothetical protein JYP46_01565 [Nitratireductor aquimarinus]|uniref:hypothetical protein n=1 Tax=Alphaproteobacteria TaxID=28211 RepID=UPI0019D3B364|nr:MULTISPECIES: hypothetical protein [Alphaproteobacteria]MBN7755499.1 hypothetical protein [Nitratireductor aquimarinus]MBY5998254.1 hypothetical protein [Tritonibacter mobilis]MBY6020283.1 hypothetical protein [Nitratireductor sp. DP7N14-4]
MSVIARIILRYVAGFLIAWGLLTKDDMGLVLTDPQLNSWIEIGAGVLFGFIGETWYRLAKRLGWAT